MPTSIDEKSKTSRRDVIELIRDLNWSRSKISCWLGYLKGHAIFLFAQNSIDLGFEKKNSYALSIYIIKFIT